MIEAYIPHTKMDYVEWLLNRQVYEHDILMHMDIDTLRELYIERRRTNAQAGRG
jgi:hypothetical protein